MRQLFIAAALAVLPTLSFAADGEFIADRFCYATVVQSWCDRYAIPADKEAELEAEAGAPLRSGNSPFTDACRAGIDRFWNQMRENGTEAACRTAVDSIGPQGSDIPGLIVENTLAH